MNKKQERKATRAFVLAMNTPAARETEVKRLSIRTTFIAMFFIMFGGLAGLSVLMASSASADEPTNTSVSETDPTSSEEEPPSCEGMNVEEGTGECADVVESESHSRSSSQSRAVSVNGVSIHSRVTVLARIRANGTPPSQQDNCFHTNRAMSLWTSYNAEGTTGWHWKSYPKGYRFCRVNGAVRDPKCHNQVKIGVPKSNPPKNAIRGEVKFVKRLRWHVKAVAKADEKVTSQAKAWCTTQAAYAYGEGRGSASAYAVGRASARGSILVKLHARVRAMAQGDLSAQLGGMSVIDVKVKVRATAFAKATSEAHAKAVCSDTPTDSCPDIPGDQPPGYDCEPNSSLTEVEQPNDVLVNRTRTIRVRGVVPAGLTATLRSSSVYGAIALADREITVSGNFDILLHHTAPSEVPAGGTDTVTVKLFSASGVKDDEDSVSFAILPAPVDPLRR